MERLDKYLCDCGIGTRSQVKVILKSGRVTVNGKPEKDGGKKVAPTDSICLDGEAVGKIGRVMVLLNKPAGYITATEDATQATVMELLPPEMKHWDLKPVGRLDKDTEGLLLLTNDGDLLHNLISPKKQVQKIYFARHEGTANADDVAAFASGLTLGDGTVCLPAKLEPLGENQSRITICEGKYHQVRRMMASCGMPVNYLERLQEGPLTLGDLPRGQVRVLTDAEIRQLCEKGPL